MQSLYKEWGWVIRCKEGRRGEKNEREEPLHEIKTEERWERWRTEGEGKEEKMKRRCRERQRQRQQGWEMRARGRAKDPKTTRIRVILAIIFDNSHLFPREVMRKEGPVTISCEDSYPVSHLLLLSLPRKGIAIFLSDLFLLVKFMI